MLLFFCHFHHVSSCLLTFVLMRLIFRLWPQRFCVWKSQIEPMVFQRESSVDHQRRWLSIKKHDVCFFSLSKNKLELNFWQTKIDNWRTHVGFHPCSFFVAVALLFNSVKKCSWSYLMGLGLTTQLVLGPFDLDEVRVDPLLDVLQLPIQPAHLALLRTTRDGFH